jgi:ABA4-like protein
VTVEGLFSACNLLAMAGWVLLLAAPRRPWAVRIAGTAIPLTLASAYLAVFALHARGSSGGFSSLAAVAELFSNPWLLLAGWIHYLAFDLFIGAWQTRDALARRVPRLLLAPCLVMTFMLGPIGLLCYHLVRARSHQPLDVAILAPVAKAD